MNDFRRHPSPNAPKAGSAAAARRRRQAEALRANLRRRKAAQRDARNRGETGAPDKPSNGN